MDCAGHGTHVAGIIGADANPLNFTGVAPAASLAAYRVFGCDGNAQNDVIMAAMIRAYEDGADIISMSLGGPSGWTEDPEAVLASRLIKNGVVLSLANGNDGAEGLCTFPPHPMLASPRSWCRCLTLLPASPA